MLFYCVFINFKYFSKIDTFKVEMSKKNEFFLDKNAIYNVFEIEKIALIFTQIFLD
jgi:hypothetical protein